MNNINLLIRDITRARASQKFLSAGPLRENHILGQFTQDTVMHRPWRSLPNCRKLTVETNRADTLLSQFGVAKQLDPKLTFTNLSWKIKACNRYLRIMEYRLERLLRNQDSHGFWILALRLMEKSNVLKTLALRKLNLNWYRDMSFSLVRRILAVLNSKITDLSSDSFVVRSYVDKVKPDGTISWRPVGAPSFPDRMFLYLWQCFFVMFFTTYVSESQHAYFPKRGTGTATRELAKELSDPKWKFIWEFDLKGAFPSVHVPNTCKEMWDRGLPIHISEFLEKMSLSTIERVDLSVVGRKLPEEKFDSQVAFGNLVNKYALGRDTGPSMAGKMMEGLLSTTFEHAEDIGARVKRLFSDPDLNVLSPVNEHNELTAQLNTELLKRMDHDGKSVMVKGFPQGSGLSPILFNFAFETQMKRVHLDNKKFITGGEVKTISYADDYIFFSTDWIPFELLVEMPFKPEPGQELFGNDEHMSFQVPFHLQMEPVARWEGRYNGIALLNQLETRDLGLRVNESKSFELKSDGYWLKQSFKFLGNTFNFLPGNQVEVIGTPKSGSRLKLSKDKIRMLEIYERRDLILRDLKNHLNHDSFQGKKPKEMLSLWGRGIWPFRLLPLSLIRDATPLTDSQVLLLNDKLRKGESPIETEGSTEFSTDPVLNSLAKANVAQGLDPRDGMDTLECVFFDKDTATLIIALLEPSEIDKAWSLELFEEFESYLQAIGKLSAVLNAARAGDKNSSKASPAPGGDYEDSLVDEQIDDPSIDEDSLIGARTPSKQFNSLLPRLNRLTQKYFKLGPLAFPASPVSGMIQSRLYNGSWDVTEMLTDRSLKSEKKTSWLNLRENSKWRGPFAPNWFLEYRSNKSIFSCSSFAGLDILNMLRNRSSIKVSRRRNGRAKGFVYK